MLYEWADTGVELQPGWSVKDIQNAVEHIDEIWKAERAKRLAEDGADSDPSAP